MLPPGMVEGLSYPSASTEHQSKNLSITNADVTETPWAQQRFQHPINVSKHKENLYTDWRQ